MGSCGALAARSMGSLGTAPTTSTMQKTVSAYLVHTVLALCGSTAECAESQELQSGEA